MICENARHENMTFHPRFHDSERSSLQRTEWMSWTTPMLCTLLFFSYDTFSLYWLYRIAGTNIGVWKRTDKLSGLICVIRQYSFSEITSEKLFLNHLILPVSIHKTHSFPLYSRQQYSMPIHGYILRPLPVYQPTSISAAAHWQPTVRQRWFSHPVYSGTFR